MVVAIITARANSKGILGKNMIDVAGKPLLEYTFDIASRTTEFDRVILSSDMDRAITHAANFNRIEVPFIRPAELAGDTTSQVDVVNHTLKYLDAENYPVSHFVLLQPSTPFRKVEEMVEGVRLLQAGNESVIGVTCVMHHPADYLFQGKDGKINFLMKDFLAKRRQDFPPFYFNNGGFYGCSVEFFKKKQVFYNEESTMLYMGEQSLIDIDTEFDLILANGVQTINQ